MYKVCCVIAGVILFLPLWALARRQTDPSADRLGAMRDKFRPLLVFYPAGLTSIVGEQRALLAGHDANLKERDVSVMFIPLNSGSSTTRGALAEVRKQFQIDDESFTVVLVGKDGGEKFRSHKPVTIEKLDAVIDAMPMRQQEMRDGHHQSD